MDAAFQKESLRYNGEQTDDQKWKEQIPPWGIRARSVTSKTNWSNMPVWGHHTSKNTDQQEKKIVKRGQ